MLIRAIREFYDDVGMVKTGQIIDMTDFRGMDLIRRGLATNAQGGGGRGRRQGPYFIAADRIPDWRGEAAVIVAGGPSAADVDLGAARGRARVICINNGYQLAPWADALYACDGAWWQAHEGASTFAGLKITNDAAACAVFAGVQQVNIVRGRNEILTSEIGVIGDGGNSAFQALNLAIQFGARRILMVGVDMRLDRGVHWHGRHGVGLNNPREENIAKWRRVFDGVAVAIADLGVEVINCSPVSTLTAYPIVDFSEALHQC